MDNIPIIVQHSGHWDENNNYKNFKVFGVLLPANCNYIYLVGMICNELKLQPQLTTLIIEYQAKEGYPPFKILDDNNLLFYIELKKREADFNKYPLSITLQESYMQPSVNSTRSEATVDNVCDEAQITECLSSSVANDFPDDLNKNTVGDFMDYAEMVSRQLLTIPTNDLVTTTSAEVGSNEIIEDKHKSDLIAMQVYKDKETLQIALIFHTITRK